ncbi:MAG: protein kinase [Elusimicrobia bacterium]|nr:protein kinase [Elusimicrobiota bacterium]
MTRAYILATPLLLAAALVHGADECTNSNNCPPLQKKNVPVQAAATQLMRSMIAAESNNELSGNNIQRGEQDKLLQDLTQPGGSSIQGTGGSYGGGARDLYSLSEEGAAGYSAPAYGGGGRRPPAIGEGHAVSGVSRPARQAAPRKARARGYLVEDVERDGALLKSAIARREGAPAARGIETIQGTPGVRSRPAQSDEGRFEARKLIRDARERHSVRDYDGTMKAAEKLLAIDGDRSEALSLMAESLSHFGRYKEAEQAARRAIAMNARYVPAWQNLAWSLFKQKRYAAADTHIQRALELRPDDAVSFAIRSYIAVGREDMMKAKENLLVASGLDGRFKPRYDRLEQGERLSEGDEYPSLGGEVAAAGPQGPAPSRSGLLVSLALIGCGFGAAAWILHFARARWPWAASMPAWTGARRKREASAGTTRLAGKYELNFMIGQGGMGKVYEAVDHSLGRRVAIKKLAERLAGDAKARQMFIDEAKIVAAVHHPYIVDIFEIFQDGDNAYLVFELVRGRTVEKILASEGRMSLRRCLEVLRPVCQALDFAHSQNLVHRDLKPSNIMITEQNHVKLMDFGIAKSLTRETSSDGSKTELPGALGSLIAAASTIAGTPQYMAPEVEQGMICRQADIFSLGVCLYEMLSGALPFQSSDLNAQKTGMSFPRVTTLAPGLPPSVDALIARALHADPFSRPRSARDFIVRLEAAVREAPERRDALTPS